MSGKMKWTRTARMMLAAMAQDKIKQDEQKKLKDEEKQKLESKTLIPELIYAPPQAYFDIFTTSFLKQKGLEKVSLYFDYTVPKQDGFFIKIDDKTSNVVSKDALIAWSGSNWICKENKHGN